MIVAFHGALAHEDRMARPIRRRCRVVYVVEKQRPFAGLEVAQFDAVGEAGVLVNEVALRTERGEGVVVEAEEMGEFASREAGDPVRHAAMLSSPPPARTPILALFERSRTGGSGAPTGPA